MFSSSYLVGLVFGRMSKHAVRLGAKAAQQQQNSTDMDEMSTAQVDIPFTQESPNQIH
jgi:hypothetical protein